MCIFMVTPGVTLMCTLLAKIDLVLIAASGFSALVCKLSQQIVNDNGNALRILHLSAFIVMHVAMRLSICQITKFNSSQNFFIG